MPQPRPVVMGKWRLVARSDHAPMLYGQRVVTDRGEIGELEGGTPPNHGGSTGRVHVRQKGASYVTEWFPSVIGAKWIADEEPV